MNLGPLRRVDERKAVETVEAIAVRDRAALAAVLVSDRRGVDRVAVEDRDAEGVRRIHEPGIGVRERVIRDARALLRAEREVLALSEEVAGRELRLQEEAAALGVAAAELDVVLPFFVPLH